jgi:hypothetical protein
MTIMKACREKMEAMREACLEVESVAVHEEVPKEEVAVKTVIVLKKRWRDRHLAIRRSGQPKKRTQANDGSRKKLTDACREMILR